MDIPVVILAGGEGRRIGGDKPLRQLGGRSLLDRALDLARGYSSLMAVSVASPAQFAGLGVPLLVDRDPGAGPVAGLHSALLHAAKLRAAAVLTIACDNPFLPTDLLPKLQSGLVGRPMAVVPRSRGRLHPGCALWRTGLLEPVSDYIYDGQRSLIGLLEETIHMVVEWPDAGFDPFFNINSEADLAEAERMLHIADTEIDHR